MTHRPQDAGNAKPQHTQGAGVTNSTPETDAHQAKFKHPSVKRAYDFARRLELERDSLRAALKEISEMHGDGEPAFSRCLEIARTRLAEIGEDKP